MVTRVSQNDFFKNKLRRSFTGVKQFPEPTKKIQRYRPINHTQRAIFVFGSMIMGKEPLEELKFAIFKNWLDTRPKMETHEPNVYPTILGGVLRGCWSPFLDLSAQSAIFWHLKTGTFGKSIWFLNLYTEEYHSCSFPRSPNLLTYMQQ